MILEKTFPSTNGTDTIHYTIWQSDTVPPKAVVQIVHGMCEYIARYDDFARYLNGLGFLVVGDDHLGHGRTAPTREDLGYFAPKDGYLYMIEDEFALTGIIKELFPGLPYFLLGHSMGSFIARGYLAKHREGLTGAIISGTSGPNPMSGMGVLVAKLIKAFKGERYRSKLIDKLSFGAYNDRYPEKRTKYDWLTRDNAIVDAYAKDPYCTFLFTVSGSLDLMHLLRSISNEAWADAVNKDLPILLISGDMDPVGDYGKGVAKVRDLLKAAGVKDLQMTLYPQGRHEILNEIDRQVVYSDVATWLEGHLPKEEK